MTRPSHHPKLNILRPLVSSWCHLEWGELNPLSVSPESDILQEMVGTDLLCHPHSCFPCHVSHWFSITSVVWKCGPWIRASTSLVIQLVIQILRPHPDLLNHKLWEWILAVRVITSPPPWFSCTLKFENDCPGPSSPYAAYFCVSPLPSLLSSVPSRSSWSVISKFPFILHIFWECSPHLLALTETCSLLEQPSVVVDIYSYLLTAGQALALPLHQYF